MRLILVFSVIALLSACATVVSDGHPGSVDKQNTLKDNAFGIVYSLPMRLAKLSVARKQVPSDLAVQLKSAKAGVSNADEKLAKAEENLVRRQNTHHGTPTAGTKDELDRAQKALTKAKSAKSKAESKLQDLQNLAKAAGNKDKKRIYTIKIELLQDEGDPHQVYVANLSHSALRDDKITLATNDKGLLTTANVTAADKTSDILINIAGALSGFGVISPPTALPPGTMALKNVSSKADSLPGCANEDLDITLQFVFDPSNLDDLDRINRELLSCMVPYNVKVRRFDFATNNNQSAYEFESPYLESNSIKQSEGLIYRRSLPYLIEVSRAHVHDKSVNLFTNAACASADLRSRETQRVSGIADKTYTDQENSCKFDNSSQLKCLMKKNLQPKSKECRDIKEFYSQLRTATTEVFTPIKNQYVSEQATMAYLPNRGPLGLVPFDSSAFVTTDYKVEFRNGYPTKWAADRPSEVAAIFRVPVDVARAVLQIPAELIKLRFDITSESNNLTNATIQQLCLSLTLAAAKNASDNDPDNDEDVAIPEICQTSGGS